MDRRPRRPSEQQVGSETEVGLPQTVGVSRSGGALVRAQQPSPDGDDIDTVHAGRGLEPVAAPVAAPVATPIGTPVIGPDSPFPVDESSTLLPAEEPDRRPTAAVSVRARTETGTATSSRRTAAVSGRTTATTGRVTAVSGRSSVSGRVSRRLTATSGRSASDPAANQRTIISIAVGFILIAVAVIAVILLATRHSVDRQHGTEAIAEAQRQFDAARTALSSRRGAEARQAYTAAIKALTAEPALGGAVAIPPKDDKRVVPDLAQRAAALRVEIEELKSPIELAVAEATAEANLGALRVRLAKLGDAATDLDALERDLTAYCANPVDPAANDPGPAAAFPRLVGEARLRLPDLAAERERRRINRTTRQVDLVRPEVYDLMAKERYGEALARLDAAKTKAPEADFAPLRDEVTNAGEKYWRSAKAYVDNRIADWKSPGATAEQRAKAAEDAKRRLNRVIDTCGMPEYVSQARALLATLP